MELGITEVAGFVGLAVILLFLTATSFIQKLVWGIQNILQTVRIRREEKQREELKNHLLEIAEGCDRTLSLKAIPLEIIKKYGLTAIATAWWTVTTHDT